MKVFSKIMAAVLAVTMLFSLCACGNNGDNSDSGLANYQVKVLDGEGKALTTGVIVKFLKDGQQVAMQPVNGEGIASKELAKGDYTVELVFTNSEQGGHYDASAAVLSADKTSLELSLVKTLGTISYDLVVGEKTHTAFVIDTGSTYLTVKASERNYFMFVPTAAGTYKFYVNNNDVKVGYYGSPYYVQAESAIDVIDNSVTLSISESALGGSYVFGLDGTDSDVSLIFSAIRTGDPTITISDMPWTEYKTTHTPAPYTLDLGGKSLKYVDIKGKTEDNVVVYNDTDGYYHYGTANGPVVLVHLGLDAPYISLQYILNLDGKFGQHGAPIREYFFDANGNFIKKEDYGSILAKYFENMDQKSGVYPLTKDLEYIIKNGCHGWWEKDDPDYIFTDCNPEIGWMFALCYVG